MKQEGDKHGRITGSQSDAVMSKAETEETGRFRERRLQ